jgi:hypothetical protein
LARETRLGEREAERLVGEQATEVRGKTPNVTNR